jgi:hypothetical protein
MSIVLLGKAKDSLDSGKDIIHFVTILREMRSTDVNRLRRFFFKERIMRVIGL